MSVLLDQIVASQNQILEFNESLQRPMVSVMTRMAEMFESQTASLPRMPTLPFLSEMPKFSEVIEAQYGFTTKLMESNKRFALELASAFETVADERTVDPGKEDATADARKAATETRKAASAS
jgi:hypothetical protein